MSPDRLDHIVAAMNQQHERQVILTGRAADRRDVLGAYAAGGRVAMPIADVPDPGVSVFYQGSIEGSLGAELITAPGIRSSARIRHLDRVPYGDPPAVPPAQQEPSCLAGTGCCRGRSNHRHRILMHLDGQWWLYHLILRVIH